MISSKIGSKDSWKTDRLENKEEYVESIITVIGCSVGGYEMFKTLLGCDSELKYDIGGIDDDKNIKWYEDHIRKQLMKLDTTTLAFLHNAFELFEHELTYK